MSFFGILFTMIIIMFVAKNMRNKETHNRKLRSIQKRKAALEAKEKSKQESE